MLYIIENVEEEIEQWCTLEYQHIADTVGPAKAIFSRIPKNQLDGLKKQLNGRLLSESADSLTDINWNRTLLLDMDAEEQLQVEDAKHFQAVLVGGILGNVPSDDRTAELRFLKFSKSRNLGNMQMTTNTAVLVAKIILEGNMQMTTNTAVLVAKIILEDKVPLEEIPMVDEPEISGLSSKESVVLPFRYVAKSYITKNEKDKNTPILPEGFLPFLLDSANSSLF